MLTTGKVDDRLLTLFLRQGQNYKLFSTLLFVILAMYVYIRILKGCMKKLSLVLISLTLFSLGAMNNNQSVSPDPNNRSSSPEVEDMVRYVLTRWPESSDSSSDTEEEAWNSEIEYRLNHGDD